MHQVHTSIGLNDLPSHAKKTFMPSNELRFYSLMSSSSFSNMTTNSSTHTWAKVINSPSIGPMILGGGGGVQHLL